MTESATSFYTVGTRVQIADTPSTRQYHFIPSQPGNTGTVASVDQEKNIIYVDLDKMEDGMDEYRSEKDFRDLEEGLKGWGFGTHELIIIQDEK